MTKRTKRTSWRRCPHVRIRGIYGDEIIHSAWYRLQCTDCGRLLEGPVTLATLKYSPPGGHTLVEPSWKDR